MQWIGRKVSVDYGISTQSTQSWIKDHVIGFWESYATMLIVVAVLLWLIRQIPEEMVVSRMGALCTIYNLFNIHTACRY